MKAREARRKCGTSCGLSGALASAPASLNPVTRDELTAAARTGKIMDLLNWMEVDPGDTYFIPAGTVHAIGGGLALCEIQQNSNVTYRLYDYGRDRELHLEKAAAVSLLDRYGGKSIPRDVVDGMCLLAECPYFRTFLVSVGQVTELNPPREARFAIITAGAGRLNGTPVFAGQVVEMTGWTTWLFEPERPTLSGLMKVLITG